MTPLTKGKYTVRSVQSQADLDAVFALRGVCFGAAGKAADQFDTTATQIMICETSSGKLAASLRMSVFEGVQIMESYAGQYYNLQKLAGFDGPMLELGRFCINPEYVDPDILRIAWTMLTAYVDEVRISLLFGCSSFAGIEPSIYSDAFALLKARHLGPERWMPDVKTSKVYRFAEEARSKPDMKSANAVMPPLLRTYLMMGGWVSDHAVIDRDMGTLHVFTGLEISAIPEARKKLLRALV